MIQEAVRYLEWRGLLVRDDAEPHWVRVLDEDDAAEVR
jgi:hypothetical protein